MKLPAKSADEIAVERAERTEHENADWWMRVIGWVTIGVLVAQGVAFVFQAHRLKQSVEEMKKATQATRDMARAEQQTVDTMERTARRQLRAYVFVDSHHVVALNAGAPARVRIVLKNFGQTPAYNLSGTGHLRIANEFPEVEADSKLAPLRAFGTLGPGAIYQLNLTSHPGFSGPQLEQLSGNGPSTLFVYGTVEYADAFGKKRFLKFRLMNGKGPGLSWNELHTAPKGNESDEPD